MTPRWRLFPKYAPLIISLVGPEAWKVLPAGAGDLAATVAKVAYLGSVHEYTFETEMGAIFVVSGALDRTWRPGDAASLRLAGHGFSVVADEPREYRDEA